MLKTSSSRVSDLRYRDGSRSSCEIEPAAVENQPGNHSPLRVKSQNSHRHYSATSREKEIRRESSAKRESRSRSPIQVYSTLDQAENANDHHQECVEDKLAAKHATFNLARSRGTLDSRSHRNDPFKSTAEADAQDFHFDFDQDGNDACSYVNTTTYSE